MRKYGFRDYVARQPFFAKLDGPLMSMGASGSIGSTLTFGANKGRNFVRRLVVPSNPRSPAQQGVRSMMAWIGAEWSQLSAANQATWETKAAQRNVSPFNAFVKQGMDNWSNGLAPQREDPAESAATSAAPTSPASSVTGRRATITWVDSITADTFGVILYLDTTTGFTAGRDNAVKVIDIGVQKAITDALEPAVYYYRLATFNIEGEIGTLTAEQTFTIT